jgi:betaine-aldehyde dehydrogenase
MPDVKTYRNYIGGEWVESASGDLITSYDPATQDVVAYAQNSTADDMRDAIAAARHAFETSEWAVTPGLRQQALMEFADLLEEREAPLCELLSRENGKTLSEAHACIAGKYAGCIDFLRYYAGAARQVYGRSTSISEDSFGVIAREAIGVVGIIVPWNWPASLMIRDMAPALAAGNAVVVKPATYTPAICTEFIEILSQVKSIPEGIVNIVTGSGPVVGDALAASEDVDMIAFTGDGITATKIAQVAAPTQKKLVTELGGKSPNVIFEDADLKKAIPAAVWAFLATSGQFCMAGTRLIVQDTIHDEVMAGIKTEIEKLKVGRGTAEGTDLGPMIAEAHLNKVMKYIEIGKSEGKVLTGGERLSGEEYDNGWFVAPTVITDLAPDARLVQEEVFGPVLAVQKFHTEAEAIELANGTKYGLAGAVWTRDVTRALRVARKIKSGTVWINTYNKFYAETEFGGCKASGNGRAMGIDALYEYTELKHINFDMAETF